MAHRLQNRPAPRRLTTLLLASAAIVWTAPALTQPVQTFWSTPSVLAGALGLEAAKAPGHEEQLPLPGFDHQTVLFSEGNAGQPAAALKLRSSSFDIEPAVNVKVDRLANGSGFASSSVPAHGVGFDMQLLNGRFTFSSDVANAIDDRDPRDYRDLQLRDSDRPFKLNESSRRHKFAAKVIDTENLRLMVDGEFGNVSEGLATSLQELPNGKLVLPSSWSMMSSRLEFGSAAVAVDYQDWVSNAESVRRQGLRLGYASSELQVYRKEGMEFNLTQGGQWLKRTAISGINADLIVADVLPDTVAEAIDPIRPFLPTVINANFEKGDIIRSELLPGPRDRVSTGSVAMTWDHQYGRTTASFWERRVSTDVILPDGEDKIPLMRSRDRFVDLSHKVRRGNWQFGAGLSMIETDDTVLGERHTDREIAPHVSVAYAPENGPTVELRFGAAAAQSQIIDDNLAARARTRQIQLSVDVSNLVQDELNRPDAKLKLEYRYDLSGGDRDPATGRERNGGHALLVTFATPLN